MVAWQVQKPWLKQNLPYRSARFPLLGYNSAGGGNAWRTRRPPQSVPADFEVDVDARYCGVVIFYHKYRGYGFIQPMEAEIPTEKAEKKEIL